MGVNKKISWVHLTSKIRQLLVATLSVTFGISVYIFMNGFMTGVNDSQSEITFSSIPHIRVYNDISPDLPVLLPEKEDHQIVMVSNNKNISYTEGIKNAVPIIENISKIQEVAGVTQQINENVFIKNGVTQNNANLSGVEVQNEDLLFKTSHYMISGDFYDLNKRSDGIILGSKLAQNLGVRTGNNVTVITSGGVSKAFKVIGIIETGSSNADKTRAIVSINQTRQLFSKNKNYATDVYINLKDYNQATKLSEKIKNYTQYKVESWQESNPQLESANKVRGSIGTAMSLTILIVAGFGIYNIMNMTVNEKIKEIAILKAIGFNGKDIVQIFLTQSIAIGMIGGILGMILGYTISIIVHSIPFKIATYDTLPVDFSLITYIKGFVFGLLVSAIAGYMPARKAAKVDPVSILRS
ncbi:ABC transporter permease [Apibacter muscae]|uniref:ABC transporter permease n=1 Tax=Apibacter muscae TaxID=2509004 RepID=UPI0011ACDCA4|nr:ABC transporter permease [Apibacter muscae]TWP24810.1 ABC transporter permease [Apibacter muscae]TWP31012.1 ABC transporter permease [Apibacter muscae]